MHKLQAKHRVLGYTANPILVNEEDILEVFKEAKKHTKLAHFDE